MVTDGEGAGVVAGVEGDVVEYAAAATAGCREGRKCDCLPEAVSGEVANYHAQSLRLPAGELPGATREKSDCLPGYNKSPGRPGQGIVEY